MSTGFMQNSEHSNFWVWHLQFPHIKYSFQRLKSELPGKECYILAKEWNGSAYESLSFIKKKNYPKTCVNSSEILVPC